MNTGIVGIEAYLPERTKVNSEWPPAVVDQWRSRLANLVPRNSAATKLRTPGVDRSLAAAAKLVDDPFQGSQVRRVIGEDQWPSDLAAIAGNNLMQRLNASRDSVGLLLAHGMVPDYQCANFASVVHEKLHLTSQTPAFCVDAVCASFLVQFNVASRWVSSFPGNEMVLSTLSSACSVIMPSSEPTSAWMGDAGAAALFGKVDEGFGLLGSASTTDGTMHKGFVATVLDGRWYDDGKVVACTQDKHSVRRMQLEAADYARDVISRALASARVDASEVNFFASHQPAIWFPELCREYSGLTNAQLVNTFAWTGNLSNVNVPMQLALGSRERLLKKGDVVVAFSISSGMMVVASVFRWAI